MTNLLSPTIFFSSSLILNVPGLEREVGSNRDNSGLVNELDVLDTTLVGLLKIRMMKENQNKS